MRVTCIQTTLYESRCFLFDKGCSDSTVTYIGASYCQDDVVRYIKGYDFVVINCGNHAAKAPDFTYDRFRETVDALASKLYIAQESDMQLFWVENYAEPLRKPLQDRKGISIQAQKFCRQFPLLPPEAVYLLT